MGDYGFKISKPGYDVKSAIDKNLVFNSKFDDCFKARYSGSLNLTINSSSENDTSYNHSYGAAPAFLAYYKDPTDNKYLMCGGNNNSFWGLKSSNIYCTAYVDSTNIYFEAYNGTGSQETITIYFHLFYEAEGNI